MPWISEGMMILVALPLAAALKASRLLRVRTASSAPASRISLMDSALASCSLRMACARPSASLIIFSLSASALRMTACLSASACRIMDSLRPSATRTADFFSPSAFRMASRLSRSAFICFSMASLMAAGGVMFLSSTRVTLMPQGSVATSRDALILVLMISRDVSVSSSSMSPMMLRRVVAVRFSMAMIGFSTPYV